MLQVDRAGAAGQCFATAPRRYRRDLLACAAMAAGVAAGLLAAPGSALAACAVTAAPNDVTCASTTTTNTTNTDAGTSPSVDRHQQFTTGGAVTATVGSGATIDGFGLAITHSAAGDITFTNNGTVTVSPGNTPTQGGAAALNLSATGGAIIYTGNGSVSGGSGINANSSGAGTVTLTTGAVTSSNGNAIQATTIGGLVTVDGQGAINAAGGDGINGSSTGTGGLTVTTTAPGTINTNNNGILLQSTGTAGNISVTTAGVIGGGTAVGGRGISAEIQSGVSAGTVHVTANADVSASAYGVYAHSAGTGGVTVDGTGDIRSGIGIVARQSNNSALTSAGVHVGGSGITAATGFGTTAISATITGANNAGNVLVDRSGAVSGAAGIVATTAGSGTVTVTAGAVTTSAGHGINVSGVNGLVTVNGQGAIHATDANGIQASSSGIAGLTVTTTTAATINASLWGIELFTSGTAGNISVTTAGAIGGGTPVGFQGIDAQISNAASGGTVHVTANADVSARGTGVSATSAGTGAITIDGSGNVIGGNTYGGILASQTNNAALTNAGVHVGGTGATTGTGLAGSFGIIAQITGVNNSGNVLVDRSGAISASAIGINASTTGTGTVTVSAGAVTSGGDAIRASGVAGLVTVNGQGAINATGGNGINAVSTGTGGVTITTAAAGSINATDTGILAQTSGSAGSISVTTAGVIGGGTAVGNRGIDAQITNALNAGTIQVTANANVSAANVDGIFAFSAGTGAVTIDGSGNVSGGSGNRALYGLQSNNALLTNAGVHVGGTGNTIALNGGGISAAITGVNNAGNVLVDRSGTLFGYGGIVASTVGSGTVTVTAGAVTATGSTAISASGVDGLVTVNGQGAVNATGGPGINAASTGTGGLTVTTTAAGTVNANSTGIFLQTTGTGGNISATTAGVIGGGTAVAGRGIHAQIINSASAGSVHITANANVSAVNEGLFASSAGTGAMTIDGSGNVVSTNRTGIAASQSNNVLLTNAGVHVGGSGNTTGSSGIGSFGISATITGANNAGNVLVDRSGTVFGAAGILASTLGSGTVTVTTGAVTSSNGNAVLALGVDGLVTVNGQGAINATGGAGIDARSTGGGGVTVTTTAAGTVNGNGIFAQSSGGAGNISVTAAGVIGGGTVVGSAGILALIGNTANSGTIHVAANANISAASAGIAASTAGSGGVTVTAANNVTGNNGSGIFTGATTGLTTININAGVTQGGANAINATATSGSLAIINNATVQNFSGLLTDQVVSASTTGINTFTNNGAVTGNVSMIAATTTFNNISIWNTLGTSTFSGGTSTLINTGTINAPGVAAFNGLTTLTNQSGSFLDLSGGATPGTLTVGGNVTFQTGSNYRIQVNPAVASTLTAAGAVALTGGTVQAMFTPGSYVSRTYTILTAGSLTGTFDSLVNSNLPSHFHDTLSYDATHAYLNLVLDFSIPGGLNSNQAAVGNALTNFFNTNGGIPTVFAALSAAGLTQASGETATGSQQATFDAMNQFMGVMADPFIAGRGESLTPGSGATPYAEEDEALAYAARKKSSNSERAAYAMFSKAPMRTNYDQRWSVWAAGFGGSQTTDGNTALGSNNTRSSLGAVAVGADYIFSPRTIAGFALAGGGTSFSVANGGSGRSDLFQAGAFVRHTVGPAYFTAALAYGWQDVTTDRTITVAGIDQLRARFNANAYSGRVEAGYRFVTPWMGGIGLTPYAAGQFTTFDLPAYAEQAVAGANTFALAYGGRSVTAPRSEIGVRADKSWAMPNAIFALRGRLAWAHDYNTDRAIGATFQTLPGASFVVNGAAQSHEKALATASAEVKWINGWSAAATFEGEFSNVSRSYTGKAVARYAW